LHFKYIFLWVVNKNTALQTGKEDVSSFKRKEKEKKILA